MINELNASDQVEFKNVSDETVDISEYWICQFPSYDLLGNLSIVCGGDLILEPGEIVTIASDFSLSEDDGELGLYNDNDFGNSNAIMDYVEWGFAGHQRSSVAIAAGIWSEDDFVPAFSAENSIEYDGEGDSSDDWTEDIPSICEENLLSDNPQVNFNVFPNPVLDVLNIDLGYHYENILEVEVINVYGRVVKKFTISEYTEREAMDVSHLRPGQYFIRINGALITKMKSFILIK